MVFFYRYIFGFLSLWTCLLQTFPAQAMQDSLAKYSYWELDSLAYTSRHDSAKAQAYAAHYLFRARKENSLHKLVAYYRSFVFYQKKEDRLSFIDSALYYAHQTQDKELIANTYVTKGTVFSNIKDYQQALANYLTANEYIVQTGDTYSKYSIKYYIASIQNYLGYYEEAEKLFKACIAYFGQDEQSYQMQRGYVSSMEGLAWSYTKTDRVAESQQLLEKALISIRKAQFSELDEHYAVFKQGINAYFLGDDGTAIAKIEERLPFLYENEDLAWATLGKFYISKAYWDSGDRQRAIGYFKEIDSVFESKNYTHPDLREAYELLIDYYKAENNINQQLQYTEKLIKVDSFLNDNHRYLINRIHKEYSTKDLLQAKQELEKAIYLQRNKTGFAISVGIVLVLLVFWVMRYRHRKAVKKAEALIHEIRAQKKRADTVAQEEPLDGELLVSADKAIRPAPIKEEVVVQLLEQLQKFEEKRDFLKLNITLEKLANSFGTNTKYLSKVINMYKGQSLPEYLNTLRIDYIIDEMVNNKDSVAFQYSMESLAEYIGYGNVKSFSNAFLRRTGVSPFVFIQQVKLSNAG